MADNTVTTSMVPEVQVRLAVEEEEKSTLLRMLAQEKGIYPLVSWDAFLTFPFDHELDKNIDPEDKGPIAALKAAQGCFKVLDEFDAPPPLQEVWRKRHLIKIGYIKETENFGTTSVSMGVSTSYYNEEEKDSIRQPICLCNAGTGGIKFQIYAHGKQGTYCVMEDKGGDNIRLPLSLAATCDPEGLQKRIAQKLAVLKSKFPTLTTFAFVTGPLRQDYFVADGNVRMQMDQLLQTIFPPDVQKWNHKNAVPSFFMPQEQESFFETLGTQTMYANIMPQALVLSAFGIGQGSGQFGPFLATMGMRNENLEEKLPEELEKQLRTTSLCEAFADLFDEIDPDITAVIALKSGPSLLLQKDAVLRAKLSSFCPPVTEVSTIL